MAQKSVQRVGQVISFLFMWLFLGTLAQANEALVSAINKLAVNSYTTVNTYYNYSANVGDKSLLSKISETMENVSQALTALSESANDSAFSGDVAKISEKVKTFRELVKTNLDFLQDRGYPDLRLTDDLARTKSELVSDLAAFKEKVLTTLDYQPNALAESCRQVALTTAHLMTQYSARSTSSASQVFRGTEIDVPVEESVAKVDKLLKQLRDKASTVPEVKKLVRGATTKWKFVRGSYLNSDENNVNYVINLYSQKIIDEMAQAEQKILGQS